MLVYIAGPMKGLPEHNYPAFLEAEKALQGLGFETLNPVSHADGVGTDLPYEYYIRESVADVLKVDGIALIPGWRNSEGAKLEVHIGKMLGLPIFTIEGSAVETISNESLNFNI